MSVFLYFVPLEIVGSCKRQNKLVIGDVGIVALSISSHEQTQ